MTLGEKIRHLRTQQNMKQETLAEKAGITKSSMSNYERGARTPRYEVIKAIAETLNVPVNELFDENNDMGMTEPPQKRIPNPHVEYKKTLIDTFNRLSMEGQAELIKRAKELSQLPQYRRNA